MKFTFALCEKICTFSSVFVRLMRKATKRHLQHFVLAFIFVLNTILNTINTNLSVSVNLIKTFVRFYFPTFMYGVNDTLNRDFDKFIHLKLAENLQAKLR